MKRTRIFNFLLAGLVGLMTGVPPTTTLADDTEVYLGSSANQEGVRPNVLFILDTSGSMSAEVAGTGKDRLDNMKDAFVQIMDSSNNINVGLMRFTDPGGPILWPVSYIDEDVAVVESGGASVGFPVNARILNGADDAEELVAPASPDDGKVDLASIELDLIAAPAATTTISVLNDAGMKVNSGDDNAEEQADGDISTGNRLDMDGNQFIGVRFDSVPLDPGVEVTDARIIFTARSQDVDNSPTFLVSGEDSTNPGAFSTGCSNSCDDVSSRAKTTANVTWNPGAWSIEEKGTDTTIPGLKAIVQGIIDSAGWQNGRPMVFIIEPSTSGGHRGAHSFNGSSAKAPELEITFKTGGGPTGNQIVGMRFQQVGIPQGTTVTSAVIEFFPSVGPPNIVSLSPLVFETPQTVDISVDIVGELADDAAPFTSVNSDLSGRTKTASTPVRWDETIDWDDTNTLQQTVDVTSIVQEIVSQSGWCGNNAMAMFIQDIPGGTPLPGALKADSYDGDPGRSPILRVNFDEASVAPNACITSTVTAQVFATADDVEETISNGSLSLNGSSFDMQSSQINGLRFPDVAIAQGSTIIEASLTFVARSVDTGSSTLVFRAEAEDDAPAFASRENDVSDRDTTSASVSWSAPDFDIVGQPHTTVDLKSIIQEVIDRPGWETSNALAIIQSHSGGSQRRARTFNDSPIDAPVLTIKVQGANETPPNTVRERLKELVDAMDHSGFTPIVDTLYEASLYFRGGPLKWGKQRGFDNGSGDASCNNPPHRCNSTGSNPIVRKNTRVSHPGSWTGGTLVPPPGCTDLNLNAEECAESIVTGNPVYTSPIEESCQANYIVLLTDGLANHNDSDGLITSDYTGEGLDVPCATGDDDETCGVELAKFMNEEDQLQTLAGDQNITTYTIGFNFSDDFLDDLAKAGGSGKAFTADTGAQLASVFQTIIADILNRSTSFAAPSLSVNAFNRLFDKSDVYFSLFAPSPKARWQGNVKKYRLCNDSATCTVGEVLDANDNRIVSDVDQSIVEGATDFWNISGAADGAKIALGGAANVTPTHTSRKVFTYTDLTSPLVNPLGFENLTLALHEVLDSNDNGILDGLEGSPDALADTRTLLGEDPLLPVLSDAERADLIDWIRGRDVDDEDDDGSKTDDRNSFTDPLHGGPLALTFGGSEAAPVDKIFVGTNGGGLRMLNALTGIEEWIFYPQEMMKLQSKLKANPNEDHAYGLDGTSTPWVFDANNDGIIDPNDGDFVRIIIGQRRGGNSYYALDVTPDNVLTDPAVAVDNVKPKYMWRIDGGVGDFENLGQTWSRPTVASLRVGNTTAGEAVLQDVIMFSGGYAQSQDNSVFQADSPGNAIYFADALTGAHLFTISSDDPVVALTTGDSLKVPEMSCPIPSDLAAFDSDGDGSPDRIYVGDTCGQVFRVDLTPNLTSSAGLKAVVGLFATLSDPANSEDHRKIFFRPDVVQVLNTLFTTTARYDLVTLVTGLRNSPLNLDVEDRAYALREFNVLPMIDANADGIADPATYIPIQGPIFGDAGTLFDATVLVDDPTGVDLTALQTADGWFIDLTAEGEKSLSAPVVFGGKLFFTTYLPEGVVDAATCTLAEGLGLLYGVSVLTGGVAINFDDADGTETLTLSDKTYTLGAGIPPGVVVVLQEQVDGEKGSTLLAGPEDIDPDADIIRRRTYWYEQ